MAHVPYEVELKLRLSRREVAALARHPVVGALKRGRARTEILSGTYFDSEDWRLARDGIALRIRRAGRRWVQTVKGPESDQAGGGLAARAEYEWPLRAGDRAPPLDLAAIGKTPFAKPIARAAGSAGFGVRFITEVRRTTIPLAFPDATKALLCLDVGEVRSPAPRRSRAGLCEVEIELEAGTPLRLFELALALLAEFDLVVEARSKAERGHALATGTRPRPVPAEDVRQDRDADAAGAIATIVRNCLRQIGANADGLLADDDPEWIHQMRVGVRRLRSCFAIARRHVPPAALGHLADDLRWLAGALGPARDLDVFLLETLPAMRAAGARAATDVAAAERALAPLEEHARGQRVAARRDARAAVASKRFARLLLAGAALAATPRFGAPDGSAEAAALAAPAKAFAADVLGRRHRKFARGVERLHRMSPAERHRLRILAKRLRYATEFFASLFPGRRTRAYRRSLAGLQAELGRLNDATVAAALAAELGGAASPGAAMFVGWAAAQDERAAKALDRARRTFARAAPFWK